MFGVREGGRNVPISQVGGSSVQNCCVLCLVVVVDIALARANEEVYGAVGGKVLRLNLNGDGVGGNDSHIIIATDSHGRLRIGGHVVCLTGLDDVHDADGRRVS